MFILKEESRLKDGVALFFVFTNNFGNETITPLEQSKARPQASAQDRSVT